MVLMLMLLASLEAAMLVRQLMVTHDVTNAMVFAGATVFFSLCAITQNNRSK